MSQHKQKVPINREVRQHMWYLISASRGWEGSNHTACSLCLGGAFKQHPTSLSSSHVTVTSFKDLVSKQPDILFKLAFLPKRYTKHLCASHRAGSASQQYGPQKRVLPTLLRAATSVHCSEQRSKWCSEQGSRHSASRATQGPMCTYHSVLESG